MLIYTSRRSACGAVGIEIGAGTGIGAGIEIGTEIEVGAEMGSYLLRTGCQSAHRQLCQNSLPDIIKSPSNS